MVNLEFLPLEEKDLEVFTEDMQEAFRMGVVDVYGEAEELILAEGDILKSLWKEGSSAYKAVAGGKILGGAIVVIEGEKGCLDFLYAKYGEQSRGIGKFLWQNIEKSYPEIKIWETFTPYFDKRNLHFYINVCGFKMVEFFNPHHPYPDFPPSDPGEATHDEDYFCRFEKYM